MKSQLMELLAAMALYSKDGYKYDLIHITIMIICGFLI